MAMPALHQAEHLPRVAADLQGFAIEGPGERVEGPHYFGYRLVSVQARVRGLGHFRPAEYAGIRFFYHLLAEIDADQVVLEDVVIEHVLGRFAQIDDPLSDGRRLDAVGHVLGIDRAGGVVVAADAADAAGNEVRVAGVLALHEDAVAAEYRRRAMAIDDLLVVKIDLGVDAQAADNPRNRVPGHFDHT